MANNYYNEPSKNKLHLNTTGTEVDIENVDYAIKINIK